MAMVPPAPLDTQRPPYSAPRIVAALGCSAPEIGRLFAGLFLALVFGTAGCRTGEIVPGGSVVATSAIARPVATSLAEPDRPMDAGKVLRQARSARRRGLIAESRGSDESVDQYYEAAVFAYVGLSTALPGSDDAEDSARLYNETLAECLRAASRFGRIDPKSHLTVNTPEGSTVIPIVHRGFIWKPDDFERLIEACSAPRNPAQHYPHCRPGIGANLVVQRDKREGVPGDRFLMKHSFFPATAILRPDLGPWIGRAGGSALSASATAPGMLELHDSIRVREVELAGRGHPLAADQAASVAMAQKAVGSRQYTLTGFFNPSVELQNTALTFAEPYQPGKVPIVFVHGLLDNPFHFTDLICTLRARPGFVDRYQIAAFRYPTGSTFLRSAALLRRDLRAVAQAFDPEGTDHGLQNTVLFGFSMGGLLSKLQITSSGDALWNLAANRRLNELVAPESSKTLLRKVFYFEPVSFIRRVIYVATPHEGSAFPSKVLAAVTSPMVQRPSDSVAIIGQLKRDNPGVILPYLDKLPSSVDMLTREVRMLEAVRNLPVNPRTTYHTILGTGYLPDSFSHGDGVVPIWSGQSEGAASEHHVRAIHTDICYKPETIAELERILAIHLAELDAAPATASTATAPTNGETIR